VPGSSNPEAGQYAPLPVERQVAIIFAGTNGYLDQIAVADMRTFEAEMYSYLEARAPGVLRGIAEKKQLDDEIKATMNAALKEFAAEFAARRLRLA
jgi:F-type H+-transporting ATPase subunit alpha